MNRRQLLATVGTILAAPTMRRDHLTAVEIAPVTEAPALIVITAPGAINDETARRLVAAFEQLTLWPGCKYAVLGDGLAVHVFDRNGRLVGETPIPKKPRARRA